MRKRAVALALASWASALVSHCTTTMYRKHGTANMVPQPWYCRYRSKYVTTVMYKPKKRPARSSTSGQEFGGGGGGGMRVGGGGLGGPGPGGGGPSAGQPIPGARMGYHGTPPASPMIG